MARPSRHLPVWRALAAVLAAFALGAQLLISGLLAGSLVRAADEAELAVICSHDTVLDSSRVPGTPDPPKSHDLCPACTCAQSGKLVSTLPTPPLLTVLRGQSELLPAHRVVSGAVHRLHTPYASRAPPRSA